MSVDIYLKLSGIPGECEKQGHADEIEILSFSFGANQTGSFHKGGQGGGAGKASISDLNIMKEVDKSSPLLFQACATGRHIPEATIYSQKAGGNNAPVTYYEIKMTDLMVSSHQNSGSGGSDSPDGDGDVQLRASRLRLYRPDQGRRQGRSGQGVLRRAQG